MLAAGQAGCLLFAFYTREAETSCPTTASGERKKKVWRAGGLAGCQLPPSYASGLMGSFCCVFGLRQLVWLTVARRELLFWKSAARKCVREPCDRPSCRRCVHHHGELG